MAYSDLFCSWDAPTRPMRHRLAMHIDDVYFLFLYPKRISSCVRSGGSQYMALEARMTGCRSRFVGRANRCAIRVNEIVVAYPPMRRIIGIDSSLLSSMRLKILDHQVLVPIHDKKPRMALLNNDTSTLLPGTNTARCLQEITCLPWSTSTLD